MMDISGPEVQAEMADLIETLFRRLDQEDPTGELRKIALLQLDEHLIHFVALRDIAAGEEIVMNYNGEPTDLTPVWFELK